MWKRYVRVFQYYTDENFFPQSYSVQFEIARYLSTLCLNGARHLSTSFGQFSQELTSDECKRLFYLCGKLDTDKNEDDVRAMLENVMSRSDANDRFLSELLFRIKRIDILNRVLQTSKKDVETILENGCHVSEYRVLMTDLSDALCKEDLRSLVFLLSGTLSRGRLEKSTSFLDIVADLEKLGKVSGENVCLIERCLRDIRRIDLAKRVQQYQTRREASKGQTSRAGISAYRPIGRQQGPKNVSSEVPSFSAGHPKVWRLMPKHQAQENAVQLSVPETGWCNGQSSMEVYRMRAESRGFCVIIDCVGSDGDMLEQAFSRLNFRVMLYKWLSVEEVRLTLMELSQNRDLQGDDAFVCCIVSRASSSHLLATEVGGPGLSFDTVRRLFSAELCHGLIGKPKLFFIQSYSIPRPQPHPCTGDEDLETDGPAVACAVETIPVDADVLWSLCRMGEWQLQVSGHKSIYLQTLCAALLNGQSRKLNLLDVLTEVNAVIYEHNQNNPDPAEVYSIGLQHTLRKTLLI
ncbi:hypothetical protein GJAV_G00203320 [Gymnothorax javanicus]|nr:hypothetical protein GJAV_G00203320 [Gymnothorax javanicus]